MMLPSGRE